MKSASLESARTDATGVYWRDGPRLSFDEIMEMIRGDRA